MHRSTHFEAAGIAAAAESRRRVPQMRGAHLSSAWCKSAGEQVPALDEAQSRAVSQGRRERAACTEDRLAFFGIQ
eukprot:767883-Pleurochrysis_carterae.AAC.2